MEQQGFMYNYRCKQCGQKLYEGQKKCPSCKREFTSLEPYKMAKNKKELEIMNFFAKEHHLKKVNFADPNCDDEILLEIVQVNHPIEKLGNLLSSSSLNN